VAACLYFGRVVSIRAPGFQVLPPSSERSPVLRNFFGVTVDLTDLVGNGPPITLDVARRGVWGAGISSSIGAPELAIFIGADFGIAGGSFTK